MVARVVGGLSSITLYLLLGKSGQKKRRYHCNKVPMPLGGMIRGKHRRILVELDTKVSKKNVSSGESQNFRNTSVTCRGNRKAQID
jgi:hypothetical protein